LDHTDFLGNSIEEIAMEKAGIIKKNCPVVLYSQTEMVYNIMWTKAQELNAPFYCPQNAEIHISSQTLEGTVFSLKTDKIEFKDLYLPLLGTYQISNCITVLEACAVLRKKGFLLSDDIIRRGLENARWSGRMEICGRNPLILLDGAHNVDGILQLANSIQTYFNMKKVTLVLGVLGDKEYKKMAELILPYSDSVILTEPQSERKLDVFSLACSVSEHTGTIYIEKEVDKAFETALSITQEDGIILCCGSLYMIGAMRTYIMNR
jgi:dihydrofolate synthase/folylpolyglutamate synthase